MFWRSQQNPLESSSFFSIRGNSTQLLHEHFRHRFQIIVHPEENVEVLATLDEGIGDMPAAVSVRTDKEPFRFEAGLVTGDASAVRLSAQAKMPQFPAIVGHLFASTSMVELREGGISPFVGFEVNTPGFKSFSALSVPLTSSSRRMLANTIITGNKYFKIGLDVALDSGESGSPSDRLASSSDYHLSDEDDYAYSLDSEQDKHELLNDSQSDDPSNSSQLLEFITSQTANMALSNVSRFNLKVSYGKEIRSNDTGLPAYYSFSLGLEDKLNKIVASYYFHQVSRVHGSKRSYWNNFAFGADFSHLITRGSSEESSKGQSEVVGGVLYQISEHIATKARLSSRGGVNLVFAFDIRDLVSSVPSILACVGLSANLITRSLSYSLSLTFGEHK